MECTLHLTKIEAQGKHVAELSMVVERSRLSTSTSTRWPSTIAHSGIRGRLPVAMMKRSAWMVKRSPVELLHAGTVQPGKYLILVGGGTAEVEESYREGLQAAVP